MELKKSLYEENRKERILTFLKGSKLPEKSGILFQSFIEIHGVLFSYRTWQRDIVELGQRGLLDGKLIVGGTFGTTTMITKVNI